MSTVDSLGKPLDTSLHTKWINAGKPATLFAARFLSAANIMTEDTAGFLFSLILKAKLRRNIGKRNIGWCYNLTTIRAHCVGWPPLVNNLTDLNVKRT